jgi:hypothetical protein
MVFIVANDSDVIPPVIWAAPGPCGPGERRKSTMTTSQLATVLLVALLVIDRLTR